jgi:hypothetical protein
MALHHSLRDLVSVRGAGVVDDAEEFRGVLDDFLAEDEATLGELNLLVDGVRLGALRRVLDVIAHGAAPEAAIREAGAALARDRGTDDPTGRAGRWRACASRWARSTSPRCRRSWGTPAPPAPSSSQIDRPRPACRRARGPGPDRRRPRRRRARSTVTSPRWSAKNGRAGPVSTCWSSWSGCSWAVWSRPGSSCCLRTTAATMTRTRPMVGPATAVIRRWSPPRRCLLSTRTTASRRSMPSTLSTAASGLSSPPDPTTGCPRSRRMAVR